MALSSGILNLVSPVAFSVRPYAAGKALCKQRYGGCMNRPADITVLIPCFNDEATISAALDSVLQQTISAKQIIVYDDCSTDASLGILRRYSKNEGNISLIEGSRNLGAGHARRHLISKVKTEFVAFLDADDIWFPNKIESQIALLKRQSADIVICDYEVRDVNDALMGVRRCRQGLSFNAMLIANWVPTSMALFRSGICDAEDMPTLRKRQDYAFWLRLFKKNKDLKVVGESKVLGAYLRQEGSLSSSPVDNLRYNFSAVRWGLGCNPIFAAVVVFFNGVSRLTRV